MRELRRVAGISQQALAERPHEAAGYQGPGPSSVAVYRWEAHRIKDVSRHHFACTNRASGLPGDPGPQASSGA